MKARKNIQIPGFRKGKAPRKMIEALYGAHVFYDDGLEEIFPEVYDFAVAKQDSFKAIGRPSLTDMQIGEDGVVTLTLTTEVYPEVTLGQYKGLEVEKAEVSVSDAQVQAELDRIGAERGFHGDRGAGCTDGATLPTSTLKASITALLSTAARAPTST